MQQTTPLFYFSGTGNTWWASQYLADCLQAQGVCAQAFSIEQITPETVNNLIAQANMIGLGFPIYGSDAPRIVKDFIHQLPHLKTDKPMIGYVTQMVWSGDGCNFLDKKLAAKGYRLKWSIECNLPNNMALPVFPLPYCADYASFSSQLSRCAAQLEDFAKCIAASKPYRQHHTIMHKLSAWIQRGPFRLVHDWAARQWSVDHPACTQCGRCVRICPVHNISLADGYPLHGHDCVFCMRCFNYCPTFAVHYAGMGNHRLQEKPPYQGPVPEFKPEMISCQTQN